jgi:enamine deaminase RidA (YjgF/YER057c/UK114 family)
MTRPDDRLTELGIELPDPLPPAGSYQMAKRHRDLIFLAGHIPVKTDGSGIWTGKVGGDVSPEDGAAAARLTGLHLLSTLRAEIGSLGSVWSILKVTGMVNTAPGFTAIPQVINGCSDLLVEVFGEEVGRHTRAAVGMAELPLGACVEIELVAAAS